MKYPSSRYLRKGTIGWDEIKVLNECMAETRVVMVGIKGYSGICDGWSYYLDSYKADLLKRENYRYTKIKHSNGFYEIMVIKIYH